MRHYILLISGKVQGCHFRVSAKSKAESLGIKGLVKNLPTGEVYVEAEGPDERLEEFVQWCEEGPCFAQVKNVNIKEVALKGFKCFEVVR
ncbi:MAG: acylphosphatase [Bernardetiaceae bacterium]|jgi:acylphosphatase|nr:acylphosphatase [Bernardetiaceae bacterium]